MDRADDPGRHPIDAGVEEVEAQVDPLEVIAADDLVHRWPAARRSRSRRDRCPSGRRG